MPLNVLNNSSRLDIVTHQAQLTRHGK